MRSQEVSYKSPLEEVWLAGIRWGTALGAAFGVLLANYALWEQEGSEARPGWDFVAAVGVFALFGAILGAVFGFLLGLLTGFIAGVLLSILLHLRRSPRMAAFVTVGAVSSLFVVAEVWLSGGFEDGDWTRLVVPAIALYPMTRAVTRAAQSNESVLR